MRNLLSFGLVALLLAVVLLVFTSPAQAGCGQRKGMFQRMKDRRDARTTGGCESCASQSQSSCSSGGCSASASVEFTGQRAPSQFGPVKVMFSDSPCGPNGCPAPTRR